MDITRYCLTVDEESIFDSVRRHRETNSLKGNKYQSDLETDPVDLDDYYDDIDLWYVP